jgi:hypothetical protein
MTVIALKLKGEGTVPSVLAGLNRGADEKAGVLPPGAGVLPGSTANVRITTKVVA